jgi:hypothetical protein
MSFTIYQQDGMKVIQWFCNTQQLLDSMARNPHDAYHFNPA